MAKEISTGIDNIVQHLSDKQEEQSQMQWRDIRNKIDSLLLSTNIIKSDEARKRCLELDTMEPEEREIYVQQNWGPNYLERISPLLHQLKILEKRLNPVDESGPNETQSAQNDPPTSDGSEDQDN